MSTAAIVSIVVAWVVTGLLAGLWMARRGHDPLWTLVAVVLGPLFVPIAWERGERRSQLAASGGSAGSTVDGPKALVGWDGSPESRRAFDMALELLGPGWGSMLLVEVLSHEQAEAADGADLDTAAARLAELAARAEAAGIVTRYQVMGGSPAETLRRVAEENGIDVLVVGRRGRGVSKRLLGSVSEDLIRHATTSVLVAEAVNR